MPPKSELVVKSRFPLNAAGVVQAKRRSSALERFGWRFLPLVTVELEGNLDRQR